MRRSSPKREGYANLPSGLGCKTLHSTAQILYRLFFNRLPVPSSARNKYITTNKLKRPERPSLMG